MKISKILIPAAGIGSRFLPITKTVPKEMLPLGNKPAIEYIVQEALDGHIPNIGIILSPEKTMIQDYFTHNENLQQRLSGHTIAQKLNSINTIIEHSKFSYFYQHKPAGLADALLQAQEYIDQDEYFAVALPDDIITGPTPEIAHLMHIAEKHKCMVIAVQEVFPEQTASYGIVGIDEKIDEHNFFIKFLIEKPKPEEAPSNLAIVGRYIFHKDLFDYIPKTPHDKEILLPETINLMISWGYKVIACTIQGNRFDTGTPQGWKNFIIQHEIL
jgi:UTP--glucose-1-phosphate uridylyltransferase